MLVLGGKKMRSILVTGGAGFIGSHLVEKLLQEKDCQVCIIDNFDDFYNRDIKEKNIEPSLTNEKFHLCEGDIRDQEFVENVFSKKNFDAVIHLAAKAGVRPSIIDPCLYQDVNVRGTQNVFECCREYHVKKIIFASSSSVYGINNKIPFSEEDPIFQPISPYAATKAAGELLAHVYSHLYGMQILCLRFFTVYGPRQRPDLAIYKFTDLIMQGKEIPVFGDGSSRRDYTYIDDIINGILGALEYDQTLYEIVNLGNSDTVYLRDLISIIALKLGKKAVLRQLPNQPGDVPQTFADISKAKRLFHYSPKVKIKQGIESFLKWHGIYNPS